MRMPDQHGHQDPFLSSVDGFLYWKKKGLRVGHVAVYEYVSAIMHNRFVLRQGRTGVTGS